MTIIRVETKAELKAVRELWLAYYRFVLERYDVDRDTTTSEMAALPGRYAPPAAQEFVVFPMRCCAFGRRYNDSGKGNECDPF